jgi:hypothetical protein
MVSSSRVAVLATILFADLFFFLFIAVYYPEVFSMILRWLPYNDVYEKTVFILTGFIIAVLASTILVSIALKGLREISE